MLVTVKSEDHGKADVNVRVRELDGRMLGFGTAGRLRSSNLIMYDPQTEP